MSLRATPAPLTPRPLPGHLTRSIRLALIAEVIVLALIVGAPGVVRADASSSPLTVDAPANLSVVADDEIVVSGTGPAGETITRDISLAPDDHAEVDATGRWSMAVTLDEGPNDLTFRVGDDRSTEVTVTLIFNPSMIEAPEGPEAPAGDAGEARLSDARRDLVDEDGKRVRGPGYQDIRSVIAWVDGADLVVAMEMGAAPPEISDWRLEQILYGFNLDVDLDGEPDFNVLLQNVEPPAWEASLFAFEDAMTQGGEEYPGIAWVDGRRVTITVDLDAIGSFGDLQLAAFTEHIEFPDLEFRPGSAVERFDRAPQKQWPWGSDWIRVGAGGEESLPGSEGAEPSPGASQAPVVPPRSREAS